MKNSKEFCQKLQQIHDGDLSTALCPSDIIDLIKTNREYIERHYDSIITGKTNLDDNFGWFKVLQSIEQMASGDDPKNISLLEFDDHHDKYRLAYGIGINKHLKRITLMFRGTYADGTSDWKRNLQVTQLEVPLPETLLDRDISNNDSNNYIGDATAATTNAYFHRGCYEYLFQNTDCDPSSHPQERYEEVLNNALSVLQQYPDYKIFISGHSLGGALALLVAFYASADSRIPKPVTCVSVGSLLIGDTQFQCAFEQFESKGWIEHLHITNDDDPVPCLPPFSWYRPVGVHLCLKQDGYSISHNHATTTRTARPSSASSSSSHQRLVKMESESLSAWIFFWKAFKNFKSVDKFLQPHSVSEYLRRLEREKDNLKGITLNDCYRDPRIVGYDDDGIIHK